MRSGEVAIRVDRLQHWHRSRKSLQPQIVSREGFVETGGWLTLLLLLRYTTPKPLLLRPRLLLPTTKSMLPLLMRHLRLPLLGAIPARPVLLLLLLRDPLETTVAVVAAHDHRLLPRDRLPGDV